jgi:hypothetical protein
MKLKRILALVVSLAMILSIVPAFEFTASAADTTIVYPTNSFSIKADGTVETNLRVFGSNSGGRRVSLLGITLPSLDDGVVVTSAKLVMTTVETSNGSTRVYVDDASSVWTASSTSATWAQVGYGQDLGADITSTLVANNGAGQTITFDITSFVNSNITSGNDFIALRLFNFDSSNNNCCGFYPASNSSYKPYLELTVKKAADVTVQYYDPDESGDDAVVYSYTESGFVGESFTPSYSGGNYYVNEDAGYLYSVGTPETIEVSEGTNVAKIPMTKFKELVAQDDGTYNYIENGDFETGDLTGWAEDEANPSWFEVTEENGNKILHSKATSWSNYSVCNIGGERSLQKSIGITPGKSYFYSIDVYTNGSAGIWMNLAFTGADKLSNPGSGSYTGTVYATDGTQTNCVNGASDNGTQLSKSYANQWHTFEGVATASDESVNFEFDAYYLHDCPGSNFDNIKFYEVKDLSASNAATVKEALDKLTTALPLATKTDLTLSSSVTDSVGGEFDVTWSSDSDLIDSTGKVSTTADSAITAVTLTASVEIKGTVVSSSKSVTVFPASRAGSLYTAGSAKYNIGTNNLIANGSFGEGDSIDLTGWYAHTGAQTNAAIIAQSSSDTVIPDGKWAYGSKWNDSITGTNYCTIDTMWSVEAGSNYLSFYARTAQNEGQKNVFVYFTTDNTHHTATPAEDQQTQLTLTNEWQKFEFVFNSDVAGYVGFTAYNLSSNSNGNLGEIFDDFELYAAEPTLEAQVQIAVDALSVPTITKSDISLASTVSVSGKSLDVTWTTSNADVMGADGTIKDITDVSEVTLTPSVVYNNETFTGSTNTVTVFPKDYEIGTENFEYNGTIYDIKSKTEFDYDWVRRKSSDGSVKTGTNLTTETNGIKITTLPALGGAGSVDAINDTVNARGSMAIEGGHTYILRFYYGGIAFGGDNTDNFNKIFTTDAKYQDESIIDYVDGSSSTSSIHTTANVWEKKEVVFTASTTANYLTFLYSWLGAGLKIADVNLYEIQKSNTYNVTFKSSTDDSVISVKEVLPGRSATLEAGRYRSSNNCLVYVAEAKTVENVQSDMEVSVSATATTDLAPSTAFSWNFETQKAYWTDSEKSTLDMTSWNGPTSVIMQFTIPELDSHHYLGDVTLHLNVNYNNNTSSTKYSLYLIDPSSVSGVEDALVKNQTSLSLLTSDDGTQQLKSWELVGEPGEKEITILTKDYFVEYPDDDELTILLVNNSGSVNFNSATAVNPPYITYTLKEFTQNEYALGKYIMKNNVGNDTPLNQIFMLGAHDSMTEADKMTATKDPGQAISENAVSSLADGSTLKDYCKTQNADIITLLESGVRYLDIRLTRLTSGVGDWYATHTNVGGYFGSEDGDNGNDGYAQQIVDWLHDNPGELMVFDLQYVYDQDVTGLAKNQNGYGNQASYDSIKKVLQNTKDTDGKSLYDYLYPASGKHPSELTYGQLTRNGTMSRLIGVTKAITNNRSDSTTAAIDGFMWRGWYTGSPVNSDGSVNGSATIWSEWPEKSSTSDVVTCLDGYVDTYNAASSSYDNKFRVMQGVLSTTNVLTGRVDIISKAPAHNSSLYNNDNFLTWLGAMPIFMVDYATSTNSVTTKTSTVNNTDTGFNPTVITDLARYNRAVKFGFSDYSVDHDITFTDSDKTDPVVMVTGSNFELPVSIYLHVDNPEGEAPEYVTGQKVVKKLGVYAPVFRRFIRNTSKDTTEQDLGTAVTISFNAQVSEDTNTIEVLQLSGNNWVKVASTYDKEEGVVTLTDKVTNINNTYMLVEAEDAAAISLTLSYRDKETGNVFYSVDGRYNVGTVLYNLEASGDNGYYIVIDGNAYIIKTDAQSHTVAESDEGQTIYVDVDLLHENAVLADALWTANGQQFYGATDGNHLFVASNGSDYDNKLVAEPNDADGVCLTDGKQTQMGTARFAAVQYNVPTYEDGNVYILTLPVYKFSGSNLESGTKVRFAAYLLDNEFDVPDVTESDTYVASASALKASGNAMYSLWADVNTTEIKFDVTDAVKSAFDKGQKTMTFKIIAAYYGVWLNNWEIATPGGEKEGLASYIEVKEGTKISTDTGNFVTKNGGYITPSATLVVSDETYSTRVESDTTTVDDDAMAYVSGGTLYWPDEDGNINIESPSGDVSKAIFDIEMFDGAQVRIGEGVAGSSIPKNSGLRFIAQIDTSSSTGLAALIQEYKGTEELSFGVAITAEGSDNTVYVPCEDYQDGDKTVFTAVITNLQTDNYNRIFSATPYIKVGDNTYFGTDFDKSNKVDRSIYQVSAGLLGSSNKLDTSSLSYELTDYVKSVLNAYINKVGVRLTYSSSDKSITSRTDGNGAYTGDVFFSVESTPNSDGVSYDVTVTLESWSGLALASDWMESIRVNNNHSTVVGRGMITNETVTTDDGVTTLTFNFNPKANNTSAE